VADQVKYVVALVPLLFGVFALLIGQDANWDLRNYHWYNAYAFLNDRLTFDVGAAQPATYYNPFLDLPFYWLATHTPARVAGFVLGAVHGLNFVLLYLIAARVLSSFAPRMRAIAAFGSATIGMVGGGHLGLLGTTFNDNVVTLFAFGALLVVLTFGPPRADGGASTGERPWALPIAGFIVGCAVGLKLPTVIFAIGLCGALLFLRGAPLLRVRRGFVFGVGVLVGIAVTGGPWFMRLWHEFGNPLFPYYNQIIQSPMTVPESYRDARFLPHGIWRTLTFPLVFSRDPFSVGESMFRDYRIAAAFLLLTVLAATKLIALRRTTPAPARLDEASRYVLATCIIGYAAWLKLFAIYRYAVGLEMLAPLVIVVAANALPLPPRARAVLAVALLAVVTVTARPGDWGRTPWRDDAPFVDVVTPRFDDPDATLIVMTGITPTAFVIPAFPPQIPFLRIHSYLIHPDQGPTGLNRSMASQIAAHHGDLYWVVAEWERADGVPILAAYGLVAEQTRCAEIVTNLAGGILSCPLARAASAPVAQAARDP
jgi:hypothetical protein